MKINFSSLLSLFLSHTCPICCRQTTEIICCACQIQIESEKLTRPTKFWQGQLPVFVWGNYSAEVKKAIKKFKYNNQAEIGEFFGEILAKAWLESDFLQNKTKLLVIPIPLHPEKFKNRGFNQAEIIARHFCQITGYRLKSDGLLRVRQTKAMYSLNFSQRQANVKYAFCLGKNWRKQDKNSQILLLDDIYTTGAREHRQHR
ncbi:MAG: ComF family protein, partial [Cyanobacteria bacterium J083]